MRNATNAAARWPCRRAVALLIAVSVAALATACGGSGPAAPPKETQAATPVTDVVMTRSIDPAGNPVDATTTFSAAQDRVIHGVVRLEGARRGDEVSYIRYFNGAYVNSGTVPVDSDATRNVDLIWSKPDGAQYPAGSYQLRVYYNGEFAREALFTVK